MASASGPTLLILLTPEGLNQEKEDSLCISYTTSRAVIAAIVVAVVGVIEVVEIEQLYLLGAYSKPTLF